MRSSRARFPLARPLTHVDLIAPCVWKNNLENCSQLAFDVFAPNKADLTIPFYYTCERGRLYNVA